MCMYVLWMCPCMRMHVCVYVHARVCIHVCACMCVCVCECIHACVHTSAIMYILRKSLNIGVILSMIL